MENKTSRELELKISEFFGSTFADFEGCKIMPVGDKLKCKIYFKPAISKGEGIYAVSSKEEIRRNHSTSLIDRISNFNSLGNSKELWLTNISKEILAEFLIISDAITIDYYNEKLDKVVKTRVITNWDPYTEKITDVDDNYYLCVTLDILPIINKLKISTDEITEVNIVEISDLNTNEYILGFNIKS